MWTRLQSKGFSATLRALPLSLLLSIIPVLPASAFRPFDGTDTDVTELGKFELEFQPAGVQWQGSQTTLLAPVLVASYGFAKDWEVNFGGQLETALWPAGPTAFTDGQLFLKHVLREGSLQDQQGPSVATEFGVLLPDSTGDGTGVGAHIAGIVSQRWDWATVHFNAQIEDTRDQHTDLFFSTIVVGPEKWKVQPAIEVYYENEIGQQETFSGLFALLFPVHDDLTFDLAYRHGVTNQYGTQPTAQFATNEIRAGVTFAFAVNLMPGPKR